MEKTEDIYVCPSCKGQLSLTEESLSCSCCGRKYGRSRGAWDLRTIFTVPGTGWDAGELDLAYEKYDGGSGFKDRRMYAASEGIPIAADQYLEAEKELKIKNFIREAKPPHLLDLGCGTGWFSFEISECSPGSVICGIDISTYRTGLFQDQIDRAGRREKIFAAAANAENLPFKNGYFEVAVMDEVVEHLQDPAKTLAETMRVLKPGGCLILTTPSRPMARFWKTAAIIPTLLKRLIKNEPLRSKCYGSIYEKLLSSSELMELSSKAGFRIERWEKAIFLPHESYLQFIPPPLLGAMIPAARILGRIPFLKFLGLHHLILLRKK